VKSDPLSRVGRKGPQTAFGQGRLPWALSLAFLASAADISGAEAAAGGEDLQLSLSDLLDIKVVTASKAEESLDDAPNIMYVITREQIRRRGYKSLKDIFQVVPGFGVQQKDIQFVGQVRGIAPNDNEKFALMINGHIINQVTEPDIFQGGGFPLDNLERIEVIVGPGGVFYGGETLCAIINLITNRTNHTEVAASVGSGPGIHGDGAIPNRDLQYTIGKRNGEDGFFASGSYYARGGFDAWRENSANSSNADLAQLDDVTGRVLPSYSMFIGSDFGGWSGQFFSQNSQMPDLHDVSTGIEDARRSDYIYSAGLKNKAEWKNGFSTSLELTGDLKRTLRSVVKVGPNALGDVPNWDLSQTIYGGEIALQHTVPDRNFFQVGLQITEKQNRHNYDYQWNPDKPYTFNLPVLDSLGNVVDSTRGDNMRSIVDASETHTAGVYISDKFTVNNYVKIVAAVRVDRDDILDPQGAVFVDAERLYFSPRLALLAAPMENLHLKLMYNRATRLSQTPQGTPLNHLWGIEQKGRAPGWATQNPNISRPEILNTYEAQAIYNFRNSRLTINYWHQKLEDYTSWFSPRTNVGTFEGDGFEYEIVSAVHPRVALWTNGALSGNDFTITADANKSGGGAEAGSAFQLPANLKGEVMGVPKFNANFGMDVMVLAGLSINPTLRYMTRQVMAAPVNVDSKTAAGEDTSIVDFNFGYANNQMYLDLAVSYEGLKIPATSLEMDLRGVAKNLLDNTELVGTQWMADSYHPQGMTWELGLSVRF
jgi:TonB-dependent receptor-like protein